jgi:hypothetical protein
LRVVEKRRKKKKRKRRRGKGRYKIVEANENALIVTAR